MQAVLCGYYGYGNGGDEALLATLLQLLPSHVSPVVLSGNPAQTESLHGVPACDRNNLVAVFQLLRRSQLFIWGGGSLIQDSTSALSPWFYCGLMIMARSLGLKTIAWAQGIGPLKRSQTRWIAQQAFRRCSAISVRDRGSLDWVKRWHLEAILAPDPVWALAAQPAPALADGPAPRIAVVLRSHPLLTPERIDCIGQALQQVQTQTQGTILLVPFQQSQDLGVAELLHHQLSPNRLTPSSEIIALTDPRQLKGIFQTVDMAIAMRLHGLMMAAAEGCRCFGISYDPKVQRLMEEIQCPGWDLTALPSDPAVMAQQWIQVLNAKATLSPAQRQTLIEQALQHRQCFDA